MITTSNALETAKHARWKPATRPVATLRSCLNALLVRRPITWDITTIVIPVERPAVYVLLKARVLVVYPANKTRVTSASTTVPPGALCVPVRHRAVIVLLVNTAPCVT